jgi:hypothetical protein
MTLLNISNNGIGQPAKDSGYIKKAACKGTSYNVGAVVEYHGKQCKVTKAVDGDGDLRVLIPADLSGVIAIANAIPDMGALACLDISKCSLTRGTLKAMPSQGYTRSYWGSKDEHYELDTAGVIALADTIKDMGAMTTLIFGGDKYDDYSSGRKKEVTPEPATLEVGMSEADFSNKNLGVGGAIIISSWLAHKDNGAISQFTFSGDRSDSKPITMETTMTVADFGGKGLGISGAIMLSAFLPKCT